MILIHNGMLMTMEEDLPVIKNGAVLIKDDVIQDYGHSDLFSTLNVTERINAKGSIIMPGLINCHTHIPMSMFRGMADDLPLDTWLNDYIFPAEARNVNPDSVEKWSLHSCREMLLSGTTTCCDGYFYEEHAVTGMIKSGIRAIAGQGVIDSPAPGVPDSNDNINTAIRFVDKLRGKSNLILPSIFCHSPYTCSKETLIKAKHAAEDAGVLFQIHAAETKNEVKMIKGIGKKSVIEFLDNLDLLNRNTLLVHAIWINEQDIEIIRESGAGVSHCPESEMKLASGVAPVPDLIEAGIAVGLGTDGAASNNDQDMFSEMDTTAKLHKITNMDPCVMDARTTLRMSTIEGARALGMEDIIGSIQKGKQADIILVDIEKPHMVPMHDPFSSIVYSAKSSDISLVMVGGKILVKESILL